MATSKNTNKELQRLYKQYYKQVKEFEQYINRLAKKYKEK